MGLFDNWKNFDLTRLPGPLGKLASAANDSYKNVVKNTATLLKGTPLGGIAKGLELASVGKTQEAAKQYAQSIVAAVPGLSNVPGVSAATDAILNLGSAAKKANGVAATVAANLANAAPVPPLNPTLFQSMQSASAKPGPVAQQAINSNAGLGLRVKRPPRTFTKDAWAKFAADPRTVGGTQPWAVP